MKEEADMKNDSNNSVYLTLDRVLTAVGLCDEFSADLRTVSDTLFTHTVLRYTALCFHILSHSFHTLQSFVFFK